MRFLLVLSLLGVFPAAAGAVEIATGSMLGPRFKQSKFYVRSSPGSRWHETYSEKGYRKQARGKLMMLTLSRALFSDEEGSGVDSLIEALDSYRAHGVGAIAVSLQGEPADLEAAGRRGAEGSPANAFRADGSLKEDWLERLGRVVEAANQRRMVVCLTFFHHAQDETFASPRAIAAAARNITDWLIENNFRNVIIDVASEWDLGGHTWDHVRFIPDNVDRLVQLIRDRFVSSSFLLPIGAAASSKMAYPASLARLCDVVLVYGNGRSPGEKMRRVKELEANDRPVLMIADENGNEATHAALSKDRASAQALFQEAAGWGYLPGFQARRSFAFHPGRTSAFSDESSREEREGAYFRAVLEHIAELVLKKPPSTAENSK